MLKNHVGITNEGSLVKFKLHTSDAINWWSNNVDDFNKNIRAKASNCDHVIRHVEHRYAQDIYEGMLEYFGK
tara:strand:- start:382 stop:597 length:216 start_codon:yes stop_codon:yes gene_type:complete